MLLKGESPVGAGETMIVLVGVEEEEGEREGEEEGAAGRKEIIPIRCLHLPHLIPTYL